MSERLASSQQTECSNPPARSSFSVVRLLRDFVSQKPLILLVF